VVRVYQLRTLEVVQAATTAKLTSIGPLLTDYGSKKTSIRRDNKEVVLTLSIKAGACNVYPAKGLSAAKHKTQGLWVVVAQEVGCQDAKTGADCFDTDKKALWYLLTSLPVNTKEDAERVVGFYSMRWMIERFHYVLKSGALSVEKLQFDDLQTTINALAFYAMVAWKLLAIQCVIKDKQEEKAEIVFSEKEIELLKKVADKPIKTVKDAVLALGKTVNFVPTKKQPLPGVKVLALAIDRFFYLKWGADIGSNPKPLQD